jgi:hypothetical protein
VTGLALHDVIKNRVLVTRKSARGLASVIEAAIRISPGTLKLDFAHVDGVTPSFLDELLSVVDESFARLNVDSFRVEILNPPTALSAKFVAIGRGRDLTLAETDGGWIIERRSRAQTQQAQESKGANG